MIYVLVTSTIAYGVISFVIENIMNQWAYYSIYVNFSLFLQLPPTGVGHLSQWLIHGLVLSAVFFLSAKTSANRFTGLRFGLVIGCLCILLCLGRMFENMQQTPMPFFTESLLFFCLLNSLRFIIFGGLIGYLFEYYSHRKPHIGDLWL